MVATGAAVPALVAALMGMTTTAAGRLQQGVRNSAQKLLLACMAENSTIESKQFFESLDAWQRCRAD
jgi:hypothetical protein